MSDLKFAIRQSFKSPGFTAVAVITLALGIGANTAIFSLLNAVWMRALPVRDPHQLRVVHWSGHNVELGNWTGGGQPRSSGGAQIYGAFPYPLYRDCQRNLRGVSSVFAFFGIERLTVGGPLGATTADALMVSGGFFEGYGARVMMGRPILPSDEASDDGLVAVITHRFWERVFGSDPGVLGQVVTLNQHPFRVVGVLPKGFCGPEIGDFASVYVSMAAQPLLSPGHPLEALDHWWARIMVRLEPGANETQVATVVKVRLLQTLSAPGQVTKVERPGIVLEDGSRGLLGIRRMMALGIGLMMAAVALVLLIACANLAGLLLARGASRQHELSVRAALGAGRGRLVRQLLAESLVLSVVGAGLGCLLAQWIVSLILGFMPETLEGFRVQVAMDLRVFLFALGSALATTLLCGLLPAWRVTRVDLCVGLKSRQVSSVPGMRLGKALVVGQVSLSIVLIVASGLLLQTLVNLYRVELGFDPDQVLVFRVNPEQAGLKDVARMQFYDRLREQLGTLPGVVSVAMSGDSLLGGRRSATTPSFPGRKEVPGQSSMADVLDVSETFFETLDIPLLKGRSFGRNDADSDSRAVVVNQTFAEAFFEREDPIGQVFRANDKDCVILGICSDAKNNRPQRPMAPTVYFFHRQSNPGAMSFEVRTAVPPLTLVPPIREVVAGVSRAVPLEQVTTQAQLLRDSITPERVLSALGSALALLGVGLSGMGVYGLLGFMVARRTGEIGVHLALGARRIDIARSVLGSSLRLAAVGLCVGIPAAVGLSQALRSLLFGVKPHDPITLVAAVLLVLLLAVLAAWLPARRASRVDPMVALRAD